MPQYAAMIYGRDVDWSLPEYAKETAEYMRVRRGGRRRASAAAPRSTRPRPRPPSGSREARAATS